MKNLSSPVILIKQAIQLFFKRENMSYFLKIYSVGMILSAFMLFATSIEQQVQDWLYFSLFLMALFIGLWSEVAGYEAVRRVGSGESSLYFKDTYKKALKLLLKFFVVGVLYGIFVLLGLVLLIVPGIIFAIWWMFSSWIVVDRNLTIKQTFIESKSLIKGRFWKVLGRLLVFALATVLVQIPLASLSPYASLVATIFGGLFLLPYYLLYRELVADRN